MKDQSNPSNQNQNNPAKRNPGQSPQNTNNPAQRNTGQPSQNPDRTNKTPAQKTGNHPNPDWTKGQETSKKGNQNWDDDEDIIPGYESNYPDENPKPRQTSESQHRTGTTAPGTNQQKLTGHSPDNPTAGQQRTSNPTIQSKPGTPRNPNR